MIGESLWKGLIIWVAEKGKGVVKTFTVMHKMPRYLLIYYKISFISSILNTKIKEFLLLIINLLLLGLTLSRLWREKKTINCITTIFVLLPKFLNIIYSKKFGTCKNIGFNNAQVYSKTNMTGSIFDRKKGKFISICNDFLWYGS